MEEYSARLGAIAPEQFQVALDRFGLGRFLSARPTGVGLAWQTVFVDASSGQYVVRGNPLFPGQFEKEAFFVRLLHEREPLPVPWPYLLDTSNDIFGWPYALMPRLPGQAADVGPRSDLGPEDQLGVVIALANALAVLHEVYWPACGEYQAEIDGIAPFEKPWAEWVTSRVREKLSWVRNGPGAITDQDADWAEELLTSGRDALGESFTPAFVMHDYTQYNVVFQQDPSWRVSGLFDLGEAYIGDGEADLSRLTSILLFRNPSLAGAFVRRYLTLRPPRPGFAERFAVYMLDDILIGWASGWHRRNHPNLSLRAWSEPYTSAGEDLLEPPGSPHSS